MRACIGTHTLHLLCTRTNLPRQAVGTWHILMSTHCESHGQLHGSRGLSRLGLGLISNLDWTRSPIDSSAHPRALDRGMYATCSAMPDTGFDCKLCRLDLTSAQRAADLHAHSSRIWLAAHELNIRGCNSSQLFPSDCVYAAFSVAYVAWYCPCKART